MTTRRLIVDGGPDGAVVWESDLPPSWVAGKFAFEVDVADGVLVLPTGKRVAPP